MMDNPDIRTLAAASGRIAVFFKLEARKAANNRRLWSAVYNMHIAAAAARITAERYQGTSLERDYKALVAECEAAVVDYEAEARMEDNRRRAAQ